MAKPILYVKDGCPYCASQINELKEKGVDYEEKNISRDQKALKEAKTKYKADKVPVLVDDDNVIVGYRGKG